MEDKLFSLPGEISKVTTMAHGAVRIQVDSQEDIPSELVGRLFKVTYKQGYFAFLPELKPIEAEDVIDLPPLPEDDSMKKSHSKRLRDVIWVWGEQRGEKDQALFYARNMERIIDQIKEKLT